MRATHVRGIDTVSVRVLHSCATCPGAGWPLAPWLPSTVHFLRLICSWYTIAVQTPLTKKKKKHHHTQSANIATQTMQEEVQQNLNTAVEHSNLFTSWEKKQVRLMLGKENTHRGLLCFHHTWCHPLLHPVLSDTWRPQCTTECCRRPTGSKEKYWVNNQYLLLE